MNKQLIAFTLVALAAVAHAQVQGWVDCGGSGIIRNVFAGDCTQAPCQFARGETYTIELHGTGNEVTSRLPFNITTNFLGLDVTLMEGDACTTVPCPTQPGSAIYFTYDYVVSAVFPPIPATVLVQVWNHLYQLAICFTLAIQIT